MDDGRQPGLGARADDHGVRFAVLAERAEEVELCLFASAADADAAERVAMERGSGGVWSCRVASGRPGQLYGYRARGPWAPERGDRFNPAKLLIDPWARALTGEPRWEESVLRSVTEGGGPDGADSAGAMPKAIVMAPAGSDRPPRPRTSWRDTLIYECHVRGMTRRHPEVAPELRGTYLGLAAPPVVEHLLSLGVTAVELLPVQQFASEPALVAAGLTNYFGYNPIALAAPHAGWATGGGEHRDGRQVAELCSMVDALHAAGIEVILDVVFNHTAEGGAGGPTLSWRGLDNRDWYRLDPERPGHHLDWSGCGNSLDASSPAVRRLVLDSLGVWAEEIGVDGFRFDLAVSLGRDAEGRFRAQGSLLEEIAAEPALAGLKLIAEPWDLGPEGYRLGGFPEPWREWNDRWRDAARAFWRGDPGRKRQLAAGLAGSPRIFARRPQPASIDFVACHDGFTLSDLVSYERKHNEANREANRDGHDHNLSRNWGVEGPTTDPHVCELRGRARRSLLATLALTAGVPMLGHGDELGRTQAGNNNAYCHDGELTWVDWELDGERRELLAFARRVLGLRRERGLGAAPREWLGPDGRPMTAAGWVLAGESALGARLETAAGELLALCNGGELEVHFQLPPPPEGRRWIRLLSTALPEAPAAVPRRAAVRLLPHSLVLLEAGSEGE